MESTPPPGDPEAVGRVDLSPTGQPASTPSERPIEWSGGPPPGRRPRLGTDFYRSESRVLVLALLASFAYWWWWLWQFFLLTRREALPRARTFWWVLVPIYGWFVIFYQFQDLDRKSRELERPGLRPNLPIALLVASYLAADVFNRASGTVSFVAFLLSSVLTAACVFLVQRAANDYLKAKYPQAVPQGVTWGEALATGLGILVFGLVALDWLVPAP